MIKDFVSKIYSRLRPVISYGKSNEIVMPSKYSNVKIRVFGNNNKIIFAKDCLFQNTVINVYGDNNKIIVDTKARFLGPANISVRDGGSLIIGENCGIRGVTFEVTAASVKIGKRVMFSYGILLRNHDSHKVISLETGEIVNKPADIVIGDHVWVCERSTILKGVTIGNDSIVALGALVTKDVPANSIAAGIPAKITKTNITWDY